MEYRRVYINFTMEDRRTAYLYTDTALTKTSFTSISQRNIELPSYIHIKHYMSYIWNIKALGSITHRLTSLLNVIPSDPYIYLKFIPLTLTYKANIQNYVVA